tara:strand:+ start:770 stop:1192 length:423 start_codon:yes stop_codon:yes gene_type:complete
MASLDLNNIRKNIEERLIEEFKDVPPISIVFANQPFDPSLKKNFIQCLVEFTDTEYLTQLNTNNFNNLSGLITINIFSKIGVGLGNNLNMAQRIRNLYNRVKLNDIFFEPSSGPTVINNAAPEGYVQTVMSISFEVLESL